MGIFHQYNLARSIESNCTLFSIGEIVIDVHIFVQYASDSFFLGGYFSFISYSSTHCKKSVLFNIREIAIDVHIFVQYASVMCLFLGGYFPFISYASPHFKQFQTVRTFSIIV